MKIEIWSDVACPWCYVGKKRFESALAQFEQHDEVEVRWRSFELDTFRAYFTDGALISDHEVLIRLAADVGLEGAEARAALAEGRFASEVRADESSAREVGINGVPYFVIDRRYSVSGARPPEALLAAMREGYAARSSIGAGEEEGAS